MAGLKQIYENVETHDKRYAAARGAGGAAAAPGEPGRARSMLKTFPASRAPTPKPLSLQSNYLALMKDKSPKYNLSKFYTRTYDTLQEWSPETLTKMSRQKWLNAFTLSVTMLAAVKIFIFWLERLFGNRCSKPCVKFDSCNLLLKAIFWHLCSKKGVEKHSGKHIFLQFIWFENQTSKEE